MLRYNSYNGTNFPSLNFTAKLKPGILIIIISKTIYFIN